MIILCGSHIIEFSVSKDIKKGYNKGGDSRESSGTFISNANCQGIEN